MNSASSLGLFVGSSQIVNLQTCAWSASPCDQRTSGHKGESKASRANCALFGPLTSTSHGPCARDHIATNPQPTALGALKANLGTTPKAASALVLNSKKSVEASALNRTRTLAIASQPDGSALSAKSRGLRINFSASIAVSKNPPSPSSKDSRGGVSKCPSQAKPFRLSRYFIKCQQTF